RLDIRRSESTRNVASKRRRIAAPGSKPARFTASQWQTRVALHVCGSEGVLHALRQGARAIEAVAAVAVGYVRRLARGQTTRAGVRRRYQRARGRRNKRALGEGLQG